jgi:hypothetical protein
VFLLETEDCKNIGIFVYLFNANGYRVEEIFNTINDVSLPNQIKTHPEYDQIKIYKAAYGIRIAPIGEYQTACGKGYFDCDENEPEEIILKNPGIDFFPYDAGGIIEKQSILISTPPGILITHPPYHECITFRHIKCNFHERCIHFPLHCKCTVP